MAGKAKRQEKKVRGVTPPGRFGKRISVEVGLLRYAATRVRQVARSLHDGAASFSDVCALHGVATSIELSLLKRGQDVREAPGWGRLSGTEIIQERDDLQATRAVAELLGDLKLLGRINKRDAALEDEWNVRFGTGRMATGGIIPPGRVRKFLAAVVGPGSECVLPRVTPPETAAAIAAERGKA